MVEVTQADREAAWPFHATCYTEPDKSEWMRGVYDNAAPIIQAFARHRIAAFNAGLEAAETLRLRQVLTEWDEGFEAALDAIRDIKIGEE